MTDEADGITAFELVAHAAQAGHTITVRMIRDWSAEGLLDHPRRRGAGRSRGSQQALYAVNQRELLMLLLHHRPSCTRRTLLQIPVGLWMYCGEEYVTCDQARRALLHWVGGLHTNLAQSRGIAAEIIRQLDNDLAPPKARGHLLDVLGTVLYTGRIDLVEYEEAVRAVFDPRGGPVQRAVGHPDAPLTADAVIDLSKARIAGLQRLRQDSISLEELQHAKTICVSSLSDYAAQQPTLAAAAPAGRNDMYEPVDFGTRINGSCSDLLTIIGLLAAAESP